MSNKPTSSQLPASRTRRTVQVRPKNKTNPSTSSSSKNGNQTTIPTPPRRPPLVQQYKEEALRSEKARPTLDTVLKYFEAKGSGGNYHAYTITDGREYGAPTPGVVLAIDQDPANRTAKLTSAKFTPVKSNITKVKANPVEQPSLTFKSDSHFVRFVKMLSLISFSDYRDVKNLADFNTLYNVHQKEFNYLTGPQKMDCVACRNCGIFLPLMYMQIDHTRPQKSSKDSVVKNVNQKEAVAKVFRTFGLTQGAPIGPKNQQLAQKYSLELDDRAVQRATLVAVERYKPKLSKVTTSNAARTAQAARYTLNPEGILIYSIFRAGGFMPLLEKCCMNSFVNLRPLCSSCNIERGNPTLANLPNWGGRYDDALEKENRDLREAGKKELIKTLTQQGRRPGLKKDEKLKLDEQIAALKAKTPQSTPVKK